MFRLSRSKFGMFRQFLPILRVFYRLSRIQASCEFELVRLKKCSTFVDPRQICFDRFDQENMLGLWTTHVGYVLTTVSTQCGVF